MEAWSKWLNDHDLRKNGGNTGSHHAVARGKTLTFPSDDVNASGVDRVLPLNAIVTGTCRAPPLGHRRRLRNCARYAAEGRLDVAQRGTDTSKSSTSQRYFCNYANCAVAAPRDSRVYECGRRIQYNHEARRIHRQGCWMQPRRSDRVLTTHKGWMQSQGCCIHHRGALDKPTKIVGCIHKGHWIHQHGWWIQLRGMWIRLQEAMDTPTRVVDIPRRTSDTPTIGYTHMGWWIHPQGNWIHPQDALDTPPGVSDTPPRAAGYTRRSVGFTGKGRRIHPRKC